MEYNSSGFMVVLYWDKYTWYALGSLSSTLQRSNIPYVIVKGDVVPALAKVLNNYPRVIYAESSRTWNIGGLRGRIQTIKRTFDSSSLLTVVGGPHATGAPFDVLGFGVDVVVLGEGELTFPELVTVFGHDSFSKDDLSDVPGIVYLDNDNNLHRTVTRPKIDLDLFCPYSDHPDFPIHPPIEIMRGCAFRCRFCQVPYMYGNPRFRSISNVLRIVRHYVRHFSPIKGHVDIRFIAPNSLGYMEKKRGNPNIPALKELLNGIRKFDLRLFFGTFPSEVRPEYVTDETISLFDNVANEYISVGFQSGSDRILTDMRRGHTVSDGLFAFDLLASHGYKPVFDFILGCPTETEADQWQTLDLIRDFKGKAHVRLHYLMPLPGTPWWDSRPVSLGDDVLAEIGRLAKAEIIRGEFIKQLHFSNRI